MNLPASTRDLLVSIPLILLNSACQKLELNAPYIEIPVVYCLINPKDSVQYVRINRIYQAENGYEYMNVEDSVTYPFGVWEVSLEQWKDGQMISAPIIFEPTLDIPKENGQFATTNNVLYQSSRVFQTKCEYVLKCRNKETGLQLEARDASLGKYNYVTVFGDNRTFFVASYFPEILNYHSTLFHLSHDDRIVRFYYKEFREDSLHYKYVDWFPRENPNLIAPMKDDSLEGQLSDDYFRYLSECIPIDPNVKRIAIGVDHMFTIANEELFRYINLYNSSNAYYYIPDYTNIVNGRGIFSCRYHYTYFGKRLKDETIDTISYGKYLKNHRFADSAGNWH